MSRTLIYDTHCAECDAPLARYRQPRGPHDFCSPKCSQRFFMRRRYPTVVPPICACGCRQRLPENRARQRQRLNRGVRFIKGHSERGKVYVPLPTEHPTMRDLGWLAAIYEGEGCCHNSLGTSTSVTVSQKDPWILYRLQGLAGGTVRYKPARGEKKPHDHWEWGVSGMLARGFLMTIYVMLSPRRKRQVASVLAGTRWRQKISAQIGVL